MPKLPKVKLICFFFHQNIKQKFLTMLILAFLNHYLISFLKHSEFFKLSLRWVSNPHALGLESFKQLRNTMRKENCRKRL